MRYQSHLQDVLARIDQGMNDNVRKATEHLSNAITGGIKNAPARTGRVYRHPRGGNYTASTPDEYPAIVSGDYLAGWQYELDTSAYRGRVGNTEEHSIALEFGAANQQPRKGLRHTMDKERSAITNILKEPIR